MNHMNNITILKEKMTSLLSDSLNQSIGSDILLNHPLRVIEACKSLLSLNLENPNEKLIHFLNKISIRDENNSTIKNNKSTYETVSIYQLRDAIKKSDIDKCHHITMDLLQLSDGKHILEFLLELSLLQSGKSLLMIWSVYKAMNFIGFDSQNHIKNSILISCE